MSKITNSKNDNNNFNNNSPQSFQELLLDKNDEEQFISSFGNLQENVNKRNIKING